MFNHRNKLFRTPATFNALEKEMNIIKSQIRSLVIDDYSIEEINEEEINRSNVFENEIIVKKEIIQEQILKTHNSVLNSILDSDLDQ
jgi:ethanolamine utilization protein EutA (predicted chaperonin)